MRPKKYPYSGKRKRQEKPSDVKIPALVVFPNVSFRKEIAQTRFLGRQRYGRPHNHLFWDSKSFWSIREGKD